MSHPFSDNQNQNSILRHSLINERKLLRFCLVTIFISIFTYSFILTAPNWQNQSTGILIPLKILLLVLVIISISLCLSIGLGLFRNRKLLRVYILLSAVLLQLLFFSGLLHETAIPSAIIFFAAGLILSSSILAVNNLFSVQVFTAIGSFLVIAFGTVPLPLEKIAIKPFEGFLILIAGLLVLLYIVLLMTKRITPLLQVRILNFSLAISLVPLMLISFIGISNLRDSFENQMIESLKVAAISKSKEVDTFFSSTKEMMRTNASLPIFKRYLSVPAFWRPSDIENELYSTVNSLTSANITAGDVLSFGLLNSGGIVEYDSNPDFIGADESQSDYFKASFSAGVPYIADIVFPPQSQPEIIFSTPIQGEDNQILGVLRAKFSLQSIDRILQSETTTYGDRVFPIVIDYQYIRLVDTLEPQNRYKPVITYSNDQINKLIRDKSLPSSFTAEQQSPSDDLLAIINQYRSDQQIFFEQDLDKQVDQIAEIGVVSKLVNVPWYLVFPQTQTNLLDVYETQNKNLVFYIGLISASIAILASIIARAISNPIILLTRAAESVSSGDLSAHAKVNNQDEIGSLATAFNSMTAQLKDLITGLEDRIRQRTIEITKQNENLTIRSQQLKTISEVAGSIAATQEIESLLTMVTHLISERFGFYHVGVFLLDEQHEYAVLRAANSEGGQRMLLRKHRLKIGEVGIVGHAIGSGNSLIATDVGIDSIYFNNPDLPLTRSEMTIPLKFNQEVIGALDVQSTKQNAFTQEDIELFTILADQISIAIMNNQLYEESKRALAEMRKVHQQYLNKEWSKVANQNKDDSIVRYSIAKGVEKGNPLEIEQILWDENGFKIASHPSPENSNRIVTNLTIPVSLRGETIAVIRLSQESEQPIHWSESKIRTIQQIADQIALTLESARLFEQTLRRAERERKALEITNRIRSTTDFNEMIQIAVQEIKRELNVNSAKVTIQDIANSNDLQTSNEDANDQSILPSSYPLKR